jgi:hypothetical protein
MQPGLSSLDLPDAFTALLQRLDFADVVRPLRNYVVEVDALLASMLSPENQPMRANNARVPDDDAMAELAQCTVQTWQAWQQATSNNA